MSSNLVIVAIPNEEDRVWKVSSEKIPHLTLLFLGDADKVSNLEQIMLFVEHAASTSLRRFYLQVDRRGELGDANADVLFFKKNHYEYKAVRDFRNALLQENNIKTAYDSATQFEGSWNPHLTLGYPETPANVIPDVSDYSFYDVSFSKIAIWTGDFEGPDWLLKDHWDEFDDCDKIAELGAEFLSHYGKKGMKWGVRNAETKSDGSFNKWLDPEGRDKTSDILKAVIWPIIPPLGIFAAPAQIRLVRGGARGANAKLLDVQEKRFEKKAASAENFAKIHNAAQERLSKDLDAVNKRHPTDLTKDPTAQKAYDADVTKTMQTAYRDSAKSIGNRGGTRHLDLEFKNDGMDFKIHAKPGRASPTAKIKTPPKTDRSRLVIHATEDATDVITFTGKFKRDATGHIIGLVFDDFKEASMAQTTELGMEFLEHQGVRGMKWGVRKDQVSGAANSVGRAAKGTGGVVGRAALGTAKFVADVNFESSVDNGKARERVISASHSGFKSDMKTVNAKPEHVKASKLKNRLLHPFDPSTRAYRKDVRETYIKRLETTSNSMKNASGTRQYTIRERGIEQPAQGGALPAAKYFWEVSSRTVQHAVDTDFTRLEVLMDDDGFITGVKKVEDAMVQTAELGAEFIEHFGTRGMRWGVRKSRAVTTQTHIDSGFAKRQTKIQTKGGESQPAHPDAVKAAVQKQKLKKSGTAALSTQELRDLANRLQVEAQVKTLVASKGKQYVTQELQSKQTKAAIRTGVIGKAPAVAKTAKKAAAVAATTAALM